MGSMAVSSAGLQDAGREQPDEGGFHGLATFQWPRVTTADCAHANLVRHCLAVHSLLEQSPRGTPV